MKPKTESGNAPSDAAPAPKPRKKAETPDIGPESLMDGINIESFVKIVTADSGKVMFFKEDNAGNVSNDFLNTKTHEPYIGCGLRGTDYMNNVLPTLYYNALVEKPLLLVGESGTGKTATAECFIQNFANADQKSVVAMMKKNPSPAELQKAQMSGITTKNADEKLKSLPGEVLDLLNEKGLPILRIQNYANIMKEEIVGHWKALEALSAEKGEDPFKNPAKYWRYAAMARALEDPANKNYAGRGILLDEITRAYEETMNIYLEPLRERKITADDNCFGECTRNIKRPRFYVIATANEGDVGTVDLPSALQTRFSRQPVKFIEPGEEQKLIQNVLGSAKGSDGKQKYSKDVIDYASGRGTYGVPCLTNKFRTDIKLTVKPSVSDTLQMAKLFASMDVTEKKMADPNFKSMVGNVVVSFLGKNKSDADRVKKEFQGGTGICGISIKSS